MNIQSKRELQQLDTIERAWDGDELKIDDGDYIIETRVNGKWNQKSYHFDY